MHPAYRLRLIGWAFQTGSNCFDYFPSGGKDAQKGGRTSIDHCLVTDEHLELAIAAADHLDLDPQFPAQARRHTGGV
jgi:hypothetical protein